MDFLEERNKARPTGRGIRTSITGLKHLYLAHELGEPTWALPNLPRTRPIPQPPIVLLVGLLPNNPAKSENISSCPAIAYALELVPVPSHSITETRPVFIDSVSKEVGVYCKAGNLGSSLRTSQSSK